MHTIVDAMNLIGSRPDGWWRDRPAAILRLLESLERWAAEDDRQVTMVLERRPNPDLPPGRVEVIWASRPGPNAADREILHRLPTWLDQDEVTIITSDRDLAAKARAAGAQVTGASAFRAQL
jgi:uncharacterized protein YaiI (UPF0178 family)